MKAFLSNRARGTSPHQSSLTRELMVRYNGVASKQQKNNKNPRNNRAKNTVKKKTKRTNKSNVNIVVKGKGAYKTSSGESQRGFAPDYGSRLGGVLGEGLHSLAEVFGFGEYDIRSNSLMSAIQMGTDPPTVRNIRKGEAVVVAHREYLGDLVTPSFPTGTSSPFTISEYAINPGNSSLFPWLATTAANFQEWEPLGIIVELKTLSSNVTAGLGMGAMFVSTQYNVSQPPPQNKIYLENTEYASSNKPSASVIHAIECARRNDTLTHLYVAADAQYNGSEPLLYDLGNLYVGSFGIPVPDTAIAEIWITYEIALYKPILSPSFGLTDSEHFIMSNVTNAAPFNNLVATSLSTRLVTAAPDNQNLTVTFPNRIARYLLVFNFKMAGGTWASAAYGGLTVLIEQDCNNATLWSNTTGNNASGRASFQSIGSSTNNDSTIGSLMAGYVIDVPAITSGGSPAITFRCVLPQGVGVSGYGDVFITSMSTQLN